MLTLNDGRSELWQWDTGRTLAVDADCSQVHFSNKVFGRSIDVDVVGGVASIPDVLLQTDKELTAWAFVGTAESGYTKISKAFKVNKRNKPSDYVFTPTDQTTLDDILERIEELENRPGADISKEDIQDAVNEYLDNNPVSVDETDPTVPDWAKQPTKPQYTAAEVGALPAETIIPAPYVLPIANPETLGGVKPAEKSADMTQPVGVDELGGLWTSPGGGDNWEKINEFTLEENALTVLFDADADGNPFSLKKMRIFMNLPKLKNTSGGDAVTGYARFAINGISPVYQNPSAGWDGNNFVFTLEAVGNYVEARCLKGLYNRNGAGDDLIVWHMCKHDKFIGGITSFLWSIFEPTADKPSAMAGATFEVWGVRV